MALLSSIILFSCSKEVYFSGISENSLNEIKENYQKINYSKEDVIAIIGPPLIISLYLKFNLANIIAFYNSLIIPIVIFFLAFMAIGPQTRWIKSKFVNNLWNF